MDALCRPRITRIHTGRMSQTSTERLRDYLAQLPPQAQALLMREFERAIERGEDTAVATFVLEQLRKVVDRKSTRLNSSHIQKSRMPSSA